MDKRDQFGLDEGGQFELDERGQDGLDFPHDGIIEFKEGKGKIIDRNALKNMFKKIIYILYWWKQGLFSTCSFNIL